MLTIADFLPELALSLPETHRLLQTGKLTIHDAVRQVTLAGGCRPDSDIDLSLMIEPQMLPPDEPERSNLLREVLQTTLSAWHSPVDLDIAAVFDKGDCCGLRCFSERHWNDSIIQGRGIDCFGIFKIQRGFDGYVESGVRLDLVYPMLVIWRRG